MTPSQDLIIGGFYLTELVEDGAGAGRTFRHLWEVLRAVDEGSLALHAPITLRRPAQGEQEADTFATTAGRLLFEEALPEGYTARFGHVNGVIKKKEMGVVVERLSDNYNKSAVAAALDAIKNVCYRYAAQSGLTVSIDDVKTPKAKKAILDEHEALAEKVETQFRRGIITDGERRQQEVRIWTDATAAVQSAMEVEFKSQRFNPIEMMVGSGARGNMTQMRQIAAMRGLVANPRGDMIPRPIKKNFREGLETLEYFIATPGARKGLVDTALRTADSGYLTRRLVDVAQELIVREDDCGTTLGLWIDNVSADTSAKRSYLETKLFGRALSQDVTLSDGTVLPAGTGLPCPSLPSQSSMVTWFKPPRNNRSPAFIIVSTSATLVFANSGMTQRLTFVFFLLSLGSTISASWSMAFSRSKTLQRPLSQVKMFLLPSTKCLPKSMRAFCDSISKTVPPLKKKVT